MSGYILIAGIISCITCFLLHIALWRLKRPVKDIRVLIVIFFFIPAALLLVILLASPQWFLPEETFSAIILHYCLALTYIASYPAAQAHSPSLDILLIIARASDRTMSEMDLIHSWRSQNLLAKRIDDLEIGGLVVKFGEVYTLRRFGRIILAVYRFYRRFLGIPYGEG